LFFLFSRFFFSSVDRLDAGKRRRQAGGALFLMIEGGGGGEFLGVSRLVASRTGARYGELFPGILAKQLTGVGRTGLPPLLAASLFPASTPDRSDAHEAKTCLR
jgi:hypothetical protein